MEAYCPEVIKLEAKFDGIKLRHIPRRDNEEDDNLARIGLTRDMPPGSVFLDEVMRLLARWEVKTQPPLKPSVLTITKAAGSNPD